MQRAFRNVNCAFVGCLKMFTDDDLIRDGVVTRDTYSNPNGSGTVLRVSEPLLVRYSRPTERVLFNGVRDCNPFFHVFEALYHLAGRNDVAPLAYYCKNIAQYSDDGETFNGAYGYRWRSAQTPCHWDDSVGPFEFVDTNQLALVISHLRENPSSRRAVLQMWNVEDDLLKVGMSRDTVCNTQVMFSLRQESEEVGTIRNIDGSEEPKFVARRHLDMTVTNRSNDLLWGMLGANYVTFSVLQEYMAAHLGVQVGRYHHMTNNLHVYEARKDWRPKELLEWEDRADRKVYGYDEVDYQLVPLMESPEQFDKELPLFVEQYSGVEPMVEPFREYTEPFLRYVAQPMFDAWLSHKKGTNTAIDHCHLIRDDAWRLACTDWIKRRMK